MTCPYCKTADQSIVVSTRIKEFGIKRIRKCLVCDRKFATIEINRITEQAIKSLNQSTKSLKTKERKRNEKV